VIVQLSPCGMLAKRGVTTPVSDLHPTSRLASSVPCGSGAAPRPLRRSPARPALKRWRSGSGRLEVDRLVPVGRPMLSSLLRGAVRHAFEVPGVEPTDPRTAVASGAALPAAVLEGLLKDVLRAVAGS